MILFVYSRDEMSSFVHERRRHKKQQRQQQQQSSTPVYVGVIVAGALVGEKMVNKGFDSAWESRNKGKLFKDLTLPDPEEWKDDDDDDDDDFDDDEKE